VRKVILILFVALLPSAAAFAAPACRSTQRISAVRGTESRNDGQFDPIKRVRQLLRRLVIHIGPTDEMPSPPHP